MSIRLTTHPGAAPASELNSSSLGTVLHVPANVHRLPGFRSWVLSEEFPEKLRITFLAGEIYFDMSKEELQTHAAVKTEVCLGIGNVSKKSQPSHLVTEYWLIDARGEEIVFQILLWRKSGFVEAPERNGWNKSRVFGGEFRLERRRNDFGLWEYTLRHRES